MSDRLVLALLFTWLFLGCQGTADDGGGLDLGGSRERPLLDAGLALEDADEDGIADSYEGTGDTDGDGTPDRLDDDSDGDGISDSLEGRVRSIGGEPSDSDGDGTPDFQDLDSDGNGLLDREEGSDDLDDDGTPDFADNDDDGDFLRDEAELGEGATPRDSDDDGLADFRDTDSDNDTLLDRDETDVDTDSDDVADSLDDDSDADGASDASEAGDADPSTPPFDTDGDHVFDFRDPDSDDDGLSDAREATLGTERANADSDGDGVTDLVEVIACTEASCAGDVLDGAASPRTRGAFVFLSPFEEAPSPPRDTLDFATAVRVADVYFLMDTTGSMSSAINGLKAGLSTPGTGLIDRVRGVIPDVWFGVGEHKDYGASPYGAFGSDFAYRNDLDMGPDASTAQSAANALSASGGGDGPESQIPSLYAVATGSALAGAATTSGALPARTCTSGWGYPCFREGAVPIVVLITDVEFHNGPSGSNAYSDAAVGGHAPTYDETVTALNARGVKVVGIAASSGSVAHLSAMATATGTVDASGTPLVTSSGGSISDTIVGQIQTLAEQTPIDVRVDAIDAEGDDIDAIATFVDHVEARITGDAERGCVPLAGADLDGDGVADAFPGLRPGTRVCFDVVARTNTAVEETREPQLFRANVRVMSGSSELDSRDVYFLVPPNIVEVDGGLY